MSYELDTNKVIEMLYLTLEKQNKAYLATEELIDDRVDHYLTLEQLHIKKISLLGEMKAIREEIQKFEEMLKQVS